jgi:hypothetical protein
MKTMTKTKKERYTAVFRKSILGASLVSVRRARKDVPLRELPAHVAEYLDVLRLNGAAGNLVYREGWDALVATPEVTLYRGQARITFTVDTPRQAAPAEQLPVAWHDGAHCGLTDWYEPLEAAITAALARGKGYAWTTGWYASKKEIASACITQCGGEIAVRVSVSDDLDTPGLGERTIRFTTKLERIREAINAAWEAAEDDQRGNQCYAGFSVGRDGRWEHTLILPAGFGHSMDAPPGDSYHRWGWADEEDGVEHPAAIPADVARRIVEWAEDAEFDGETVIGGWTVKGWK